MRGTSPAGWCAPRGLLVLLVVGGVLVAPVQAAAAEGWRDVLQRAAEAARTTPYDAEALVVSVAGERSYVTRLQVRSSAAGAVVVDAGEQWRVAVDDEGGGLVHEAEGWVVPLPGLDWATAEDLRRLEDKYDVELTGTAAVMGRPCTTVAIARRADGALRERLWIDDESGLVVRRERYDGGDDPVRLATYLTLDLDPASVHRSLRDAGTSTLPQDARRQVLGEVGGRELAALRESGWEVPDGLPAGYAPVGVYAVDAVASQPLQLVYSDGLYVVSVFQHRGVLDWSSLPPGASPVDDLDFLAYEWPGAVPQRLVWQAGERTWAIVGDAPQEDLLALAAALPQPAAPGFLERLRRGLSRLWHWVTG